MTFEHNFSFDPTCGYTREALLSVGLPDAPSDFDTFWRATFAETQAVPLDMVHMREDSSHPNVAVFDIAFTTFGNVRIGGWLVAPRRTKPTCGFVIGHGYGGRTAPELALPVSNAVAIFPCAPGFNKSATPDIPDRAVAHVVHGIAHRDTYILRHSVAALWSAASALLELHPEVVDRLYCIGGSFGGGLGALALPWDNRFRKAHLRVPTFGHHPLRLQCPCSGSGESVRTYYAQNPRVVDVLQYYDAATAASRIHIPALGAPALFDPAVPPPGQFAVCNVLSDMHMLSAGHFEYPEQIAETEVLQQKLAGWFAA